MSVWGFAGAHPQRDVFRVRRQRWVVAAGAGRPTGTHLFEDDAEVFLRSQQISSTGDRHGRKTAISTVETQRRVETHTRVSHAVRRDACDDRPAAFQELHALEVFGVPPAGTHSEVIRAIWCEWVRIASQSEVIRAILFDDSQ